MTRPLETLVAGTRALGQGDFDYELSVDGAAEVRELALAFDECAASSNALTGSCSSLIVWPPSAEWPARYRTIFATTSPPFTPMPNS